MYKDLDPLLHSQLRLTVISFLITKDTSDFNELKKFAKATDGNLSIQLKKLESAGYIKIIKGFKDNYQHTSIAITKTGINAFKSYVDALKTYIDKK